MKIIRNNASIGQGRMINMVYINDQTLITAIFTKVGEITDQPNAYEKDFSGYSYENLNALLKENVGLSTLEIPEQMRKVFDHEQIGGETPGYFCFHTALKFTKNDPGNKSRFDMSGPAMWTFPIKDNQYSRAFNLNPYTAIAREQAHSFFYKERMNSPMTLICPFEDSPMEECILTLNGDTSFPGQSHDVRPFEKSFFKYLPVPKISIGSEVAADQVLEGTIEIQTFEGDKHQHQKGEIFLETTAGQLSKTRFMIGKDRAFKIRATDLEAGDQIKIKAGWRNYPGMSDATIVVK